DLKPTLNIAGGGFAVPLDDGDSLRKQVAAAVAAHSGGIEYRAVFVARLLGSDRLEIFRSALRLQMAHHLFDLFVGDKGSMHAADASAACHVEHVALAKQLLGAHFAEDGAAVDFRSDLKRDAGRKVRLDSAGDDVDRRTLGSEDHMQTGGASHLREALHRAFD